MAIAQHNRGISSTMTVFFPPWLGKRTYCTLRWDVLYSKQCYHLFLQSIRTFYASVHGKNAAKSEFQRIYILSLQNIKGLLYRLISAHLQRGRSSLIIICLTSVINKLLEYVYYILSLCAQFWKLDQSFANYKPIVLKALFFAPLMKLIN